MRIRAQRARRRARTVVFGERGDVAVRHRLFPVGETLERREERVDPLRRRIVETTAHRSRSQGREEEAR
jgi:hypothetical protein